MNTQIRLLREVTAFILERTHLILRSEITHRQKVHETTQVQTGLI